ncbi:PREDICTED: SID1 transmembrane family member 1-like, partial [Apaloderma vittatum]|uniref:SID1 transmembrane family member 1-like n=1 Tax=Apaloderma vittatum TaxID=57397 RepID=UPI0005218779
LGIFRRAAMVLYTDCIQQCSRPMYMDRMVLLIVGNLVNWSFAIFGLVYRPRDFASYILGIFICNLLLYLAFYIIMKLRSNEKLLPIPLFCIVATAVVWASALYFFFQNLSSWEETPAESREKNRPCILLGFFDDHDVWHFLSAAALFFSFLVSPLLYGLTFSSFLTLSSCMELWLLKDPTEMPHLLCLALPPDILCSWVLLASVSGIRLSPLSLPVHPSLEFPLGLWVTQL